MGQGMRVYGSTFLWFVPFVRSVMEHSICIGEVIHYLHNNVNKDVLYGQTQTCDKVTEFFIRILVVIIELHLSKGRMATASYFSHIWVDMVMQGATLSDSCNTRIHDRRMFSSTALPFGRGTLMPAVDVGALSKACMKLIRSLLKEGGRIGTVPESAKFLDLINKHMRGVSSRTWNLDKSEYENLKKCLLKLVKAIANRPAVSNDILPCAPPTPPSEPSENVISYPTSTLTPPLQDLHTKDAKVGPSGLVYKDEPLWEDGECQGSFHEGREEIIKAKDEPCNPIPVSEFRPLFEVTCIKPDLGKIQEIRSRLNDDQNLSRIQAIAKKRFETEDMEDKCSGLKGIEHLSVVSPQPSTSQSKIPDSAWLSKSSKRKFDEDYEPLDVRRHRLKKALRSRVEDSTDARRVSLQLSRSADEVHESVITISDDDYDDDSSNDRKPLENRVKCEPLLDHEFTKSPSRDYDDLSESQVFEFETQEDIASAWNEPHLDISVVTKKHEPVNNSKACISHDSVEPMDTQPVSDEDIEKACLQVEAQICQKQQHQEPSRQVLPKTTSNEKCSFRESKVSNSPPGKTVLTDKKGKQWLNRKPPVIEAPSQKIKKHCRSKNSIPQGNMKQSSSTMRTSSSVVSHSAITPSRGCSASSVARSPSTPAVVPPKKIRKPVEPKSAAERLGLKKKERKAFDLSQPSLVSLSELRSHGQNVHVEPQQKSKRVNQQKFGAKKGKKLLASQEFQFFKQSRGMPLQRSECQKARTASTAAVATSKKYPVPDTLPKAKPASVQEPSDEEDDYSFLPCSQPDPDRRMDSKVGTSEGNSNLSNDSKNTISDSAKNSKSKEFSSLQNDKSAGGSMSKGTESRDENSTDDDEWTYLTQNEPTDMELCSQMEQMEEEYGDNLIPGNVSMDSNPGNQPNRSEGEARFPLKPSTASTPLKSLPAASTETSLDGHVFLIPSKKPKPSTTKIYTSSSRSATLAKEMEKIVNPLSAANVAKSKVARPSPAMQLPLAKSTPHHEFRQPLPPRPSLQNHSPNQVSSPSTSNVGSASHVPSYKTYSRPETPVQTPTVAPNRRFDASQMFDLKQAILKWEYSMFENYKMFGTPKDLCQFDLKNVPMVFSSYQEYFSIMYPLLLINTFEEVSFIVLLYTALDLYVVHYEL